MLSHFRILLFGLGLMSAWTAWSSPRITEFMAANESGLKDADGDYSDWIEVFNPDNTPISLAGYHLTDNPANLDKWTFPAVTLNPGAYLVVFASGKDRVDPAAPLHTDFSLSADGEYLALVAPNGVTVLSSFAPASPPQFENSSFGISDGSVPAVWSFYATPTPGLANPAGTRAGPVINLLVKDPPPPVTGPLTISAAVRAVNDPIASVNLFYRRMFNSETNVVMRDDGTGGDPIAGDGIWTAIIPAGALAPGEMTRWRMVATDRAATETREPAFRASRDSPQYFGTVAHDAATWSLLPVFHWFTSSANGANSTTGSRGSVYYDGEFYDNVLFSLHGQSSAGFPKKSYNIDFNRPQRFRWSTKAPRVADIDLITNWADKSKVRHVLGYEVMREAGVPAHFAFTVRVEQNGNFFSTADMVEDGDDLYLERAGLNKQGALYKVYSNTLNKDAGDTGNTGVEKKNRQFESNQDLQALINGLDLTGSALRTYLYDNIDLPRCINLLAASSVIRNIDMHAKNWYAYRDTGRSDEWAILPWDLDLSHGRFWNPQNTYFDNNLYTDGYVVNGTAIRLVAHLFADPALRSMILRRIRTLSDRFLQPVPAAGTPESELYYERRLNEQLALIDPPSIVPSDARRDFEKWGSWLQGGSVVPSSNTSVAVETMAEAIQRWKTEYLPARRRYIYNTQIVGKGGQIPLPQAVRTSYTYTPLVVAGAATKVWVPADNSLGVTWVGIPSFEPFDTTGWISGTTGVGYERDSGYESLIGVNVDTQMRGNNSVYLRIEFNSDPSATVERLELRMKYDDGFVAFLNGTVLAAVNSPASPQWNSAATAPHEASASTFTIFDVTAKKGSLRAGRNVLAIQGLNDSVNSRHLVIVPELHVATAGTSALVEPLINFGEIDVSPVSGNQDAEFIQLLNPNSIAVDISDWRLTGGVEHTFLGGTVIPANGALYVCPSAAAFRSRTVSPKGGSGLFVQGGYQGHLSSLGETIQLIDSSGATNNSLTYPGQPTDAQRYLVIDELMYHPSGDGLAEYIGLLNISAGTTLDLSGVRFTQGVEFNFAGGAVTSLPPGGRVLVVRDLAAFRRVHGSNLPVAGIFANDSALSNGGERIKLEDADNQTIREFTYDDSPPWPPGTDGAGYSLVLIAPQTNPDPDLAANWRFSAHPGGSPGGSDVVPFPADPLGDDNGNGEPNLVDYALGTDLGGVNVMPTLTQEWDPLGGPSKLLFSYPQSIGAERVRIEILHSSDLKTWLDADPYLDPATIQLLGDGRTLVTRSLKSPWARSASIYLRLRVTAQ